MGNSVSFDSSTPLQQLAAWIKTNISDMDRKRLAKMIQSEESSPGKAEILNDIQAALREEKAGTLKSRPASDFLNEL